MDMVTKVRQVVRAVLEKQFPKINIVKVEVSRHRDDNENAIIEIEVVFDAGQQKIDPAKLHELPRLIMPKLAEVKETGFPLLSFISKADLGGKSETA